LVIALVIVGSGLEYRFLIAPLNFDSSQEPLVIFLVLLPSVIAAVLIGMRFRSGWWALGLAAAIVVLTTLNLEPVAKPKMSRNSSDGRSFCTDPETP
jgi:hypothetical protein